MRQAKILSEDLKEDGITESDLYLDYFHVIRYENLFHEVVLLKKNKFILDVIDESKRNSKYLHSFSRTSFFYTTISYSL